MEDGEDGGEERGETLRVESGEDERFALICSFFFFDSLYLGIIP